MIKRIVSILLLVTLVMSVPFTMSSCKGPIDDAQLIAILTDLLPKDAQLNSYIWGNGLSTMPVEEEGVTASRTPVYYPVNNCPYPNIKAFRAAIAEVYTEEMCLIIDQYAFENTGGVMSRFCDDLDDEGKVIGIRMDVTDNHKPYNLTTTAYISSATVLRSTSTMMDAAIDVTYGKDGERSDTIEISLLNIDGTWKINSQTWIIAVEN